MRLFQLLGLLAVGGAGLAASGCATPEGPRTASRPNPFAIESGREIAEFHCASCHQIGPKGESPSLMAPPFQGLYISYSRLAFRKAVMTAAGEGPHAMPGYDLSREQVDDLLAYLESARNAAATR